MVGNAHPTQELIFCRLGWGNETQQQGLLCWVSTIVYNSIVSVAVVSVVRYERTLQMIQEQLNNICVYLCSSFDRGSSKSAV